MKRRWASQSSANSSTGSASLRARRRRSWTATTCWSSRGRWSDGGSFHANLRASDGLKPQKRRYVEMEQAPDRVREVYERALPHYERLQAFRLLVTVPKNALRDDATDIRFILTEINTGNQATYDSIFRGPER